MALTLQPEHVCPTHVIEDRMQYELHAVPGAASVEDERHLEQARGAVRQDEGRHAEGVTRQRVDRGLVSAAVHPVQDEVELADERVVGAREGVGRAGHVHVR